MTKPDIHAELNRHLNGNGTANDNRTTELYRLWHKLPDYEDVPLEWVEDWAFHIYNEPCEYVARLTSTEGR